MPIHDWTRVPAGLFHHFHQSWSIRMTDAMNDGLLPPGVAALVEQRAGLREPGRLGHREPSGLARRREAEESSLATAYRPAAEIVRRTTKEIY